MNIAKATPKVLFVFVSCILLMHPFAIPVSAGMNTDRAANYRYSSALPVLPDNLPLYSQASNKFGLARRDEANYNKFEILFLSRLHSLIFTHYSIIRSQYVVDWENGIKLDEDFAAITREFFLATSPGTDGQNSTGSLGNFFKVIEDYYRGKAQICREIMRAREANKISDFVYNQFFNGLVKENSNGVTYPPKERLAVEPFLTRMQQLDEAGNSTRDDVNKQLSKLLGIDWRLFYTNFRIPLKFDLPIDKSKDRTEANYLYESYIRGSNVDLFLAAHYQDNLVKGASVAVKATFENVEDILVFWAELYTDRLKATFFVDYAISGAIDCTELSLQQSRIMYYATAVELHDTVDKKVSDLTSKLANLKLLFPLVNEAKLTGQLLQEYQRISALLEEHLGQRTLLNAYSQRMSDFSRNSLKKAQSGESNIISDEVKQAVTLTLGLAKYVKQKKAGTHSKESGEFPKDLPTPCGIVQELISLGATVPVDSASGKEVNSAKRINTVGDQPNKQLNEMPSSQNRDQDSQPKQKPNDENQCNFMIQVASYDNASEAEQRASVLRASGINVQIAKASVLNKGIMYRVQTGCFSSRQTADEYGRQLKTRALIIDFFVVKVVR